MLPFSCFLAFAEMKLRWQMATLTCVMVHLLSLHVVCNYNAHVSCGQRALKLSLLLRATGQFSSGEVDLQLSPQYLIVYCDQCRIILSAEVVDVEPDCMYVYV